MDIDPPVDAELLARVDHVIVDLDAMPDAGWDQLWAALYDPELRDVLDLYID